MPRSMRHQVGQALDVLAMDLDQLEHAGAGLGAARRIDRRVRRLHQRRLAHAARAPEQRVVGRQAAWRSARYCPSARRARGRCPRSSAMSTRLTLGTGISRRPSGCQTKASAAFEVGGGGRARAQALQRVGDAPQRVGLVLGRRGLGVHGRGSLAIHRNRVSIVRLRRRPLSASAFRTARRGRKFAVIRGTCGAFPAALQLGRRPV